MKNSLANFEERKYVIGGIILTTVVIFIAQLFYLQIVKTEYKENADNNAFFRRTLYPARGTIFDRNNKLLVYNQPTYDIIFVPREMSKTFDTLDFCHTLGMTKLQFEERMAGIKDRNRNPGYSPYTVQTFMTQLTGQQSSLLQEKLYKFSGFFIQNRTLRQYSYPNAGQLFGYVSELSRTEIEKDLYYSRGDYGGKSGIELHYEKHLRGDKGQEILLRDAKGRLQGKYENGKYDKSPKAGRNMTLSLDMDLQAYGEQLLKNKIGSVIMIEPATGEVLCMATTPTYDPAMLLGRDFSKNYFELEKNPIRPLYNRATQGVYPPGSVFKPSQGLIFLQEGAITTSSAYPCARGYIPLGGRPKCHGHYSPIAIVGAIATSCNSFFCYGLTNMLQNKKYTDVGNAFDTWGKYISEMGFGSRTGIDIPSENTGFIPDNKFYTKYHTKRWKAANVISIAIGQGEITTTPIQLANFAATIANRGYYYTPHVVKEIEGMALDSTYTTKREVGIDKQHWNTIADGMAGAVTGGTARGINLLPDIVACGKTGTAENPHGKDHSVFIGFAPKDNPKVAIAVVIENAGFGATYAVPTARLMLQKYFKGKIPDREIGLETYITNTVILPAEYLLWKKDKEEKERIAEKSKKLEKQSMRLK